MRLGASTIKWTTLGPIKCLSEIDSKKYINFGLCKKIIKNSKHIDLQSQAVYIDKKKSPKPYIYSRRQRKSCESGDIEQMILSFLLRYDKIYCIDDFLLSIYLSIYIYVMVTFIV